MSSVRDKSFIKNYKLRIQRKLKGTIEETECVKDSLVVALEKIKKKAEAIQQNDSDSFFDVYEEVNKDLDKFSEKLFLINNILCAEESDVAEDIVKQDHVPNSPLQTDCKSSEYSSCTSSRNDDDKSNQSKSSLKESCDSNSTRNEISFSENVFEDDSNKTSDNHVRGFNVGESHRISNAETFTGPSSITRDSGTMANDDDGTNINIDGSQAVQKVTNPSLENSSLLDRSFSQDSFFYSVSSMSKDSLYSCPIANVNYVPSNCESVVYESLERVHDVTSPASVRYDEKSTNATELRIASPRVEIGSCIDGILSEFHSPSDFWIHLLCFPNYGIEAFDTGTLRKLGLSQVKIHQYCLAPLLDCPIVPDRAYRRATIIKLLPASESGSAVVFFIDYGCERTVDVCHLIEMPPSLFSTPACGIRCCLSGVVHEGYVWSDMAMEAFSKMCESDRKVFIVAEENYKFVVEIKSVDLNDDENDLTEYMLLAGLASPVSSSKNVKDSQLKNIDYYNDEHLSDASQSNIVTKVYEPVGRSVDINNLQSKDTDYCNYQNQDNLNENNARVFYDSVRPATNIDDFQLKGLDNCKQENTRNDNENNTKELDDVSCLTVHMNDLQLKDLDICKPENHDDVNKNNVTVRYDSGYVTVDMNSHEKGDFSSEEAVDLNNLKIINKRKRKLSDSDKKSVEEVEEMTQGPLAKNENSKEVEDFAWDVQIPPPQLTCISDNHILVMASAIYTPFEIYVNPACENAADLDSLLEQMTRFYEQKEEQKELVIKAEDLKVGLFCCSQNSVDQHWYRVQVLEVHHPTNEKPKALIQYVDFGDSYVVDVESLRPLTKKFAKYPAFAILCSLAHIRPKCISENDPDEWDKYTVKRLKSILGYEKCFTAEIIGNKTLLDGRTTLNVLLWKSEPADVLLWKSEPADVLVNDMLVNEGLAELSPEMLERKSNDCSLDSWNPIAEDYYRVENSYGVDIYDPEMAIVGYKPKDERYICKFFANYGKCYRKHCTFEHVVINQDGVTLDQDEVCVMDNPVVLPRPNVDVFAQISTMINPGHFYLVFPYGIAPIRDIHYLGLKQKGPHVEMEALLKAMNSHYSAAPFKELTTVALSYGTIVAAKSGKTKRWLRARIIEVLDVDKDVKVFFVDFGYVEWVRREHIQEIKKEFAFTPFQAVESFLSGVEPWNHENIGKWSHMSRIFFKQLVEGKILIIHVKELIGYTLFVDLQLSESDGCIRVNDLLVEQGFACHNSLKHSNNHCENKTNVLQNGDDIHCDNKPNNVEMESAICDLSSALQPG